MPKQNVPALRLHGFSGEWETVSLDELQKRRLVTLGRGEVISQIDINAHPGNYPIYSSSAKNDGLFGRYGRYMFSDERITWSIDGGGQFFYRSAHRYSVTNVCGWMKINTNTIDTSFLYLALYLQWLEQSFDYSVKAHPSNIVQIYNPHFPPTLEEQQAIGAIFTNLDAAINQHTLKHKALQQSKTALMQRMFPQEGQTVPELRLEGFDGEWEEKRLVDEVSFFSGLTYTPSDVVEHDGTLVLRSSNVQDGVIATKDCVYVRTDAVNVQNVRKNDIIMVVRNGSRSLIGKHAVVQKPMPSTVIGAFMTGIRSDQPWFINALFDTGLFKYEVDKSMGATINQITGGMFAGMSFFFPPTLEEQQAIGAIFTKLDALIAAEAQYIKSLSQAKTALLQRMFI